jgi:hypothetical protein
MAYRLHVGNKPRRNSFLCILSVSIQRLLEWWERSHLEVRLHKNGKYPFQLLQLLSAHIGTFGNLSLISVAYSWFQLFGVGKIKKVIDRIGF